MRLSKADRESLRGAMPGDVITVAEANRNEAFSLVWTLSGEWALLHGTVDVREPGRITERIVEALRGDAAHIAYQLSLLGAKFPLPEQASGATDFPTPRDIFWRRCLDRMPGELLEGPEYKRRMALSLVRVRSGWKVMRMDEPDADHLVYGNYLDALYTDEDVEIRVLRWWRGTSIGNRDGVIPENQIRGDLRLIGVDPDLVLALPDEEEDDDDPMQEIWDAVAAAQDFKAAERTANQEAPTPLSVDVIPLESPIEERIRRSRCNR